MIVIMWKILAVPEERPAWTSTVQLRYGRISLIKSVGRALLNAIGEATLKIKYHTCKPNQLVTILNK